MNLKSQYLLSNIKDEYTIILQQAINESGLTDMWIEPAYYSNGAMAGEPMLGYVALMAGSYQERGKFWRIFERMRDEQ